MRYPHIQELLNKARKQLTSRLNATGAWFQHARTQEIDISAFKDFLTRAGNRLRELTQRDFSLRLENLRPWLRQHQRQFSLYLILPIAVAALVVLIKQQTTSLNHALALRPAQLTALESLIQASKSGPMVSSAPPLTDADLETLRVILQNRGITPNILRLNLDHNGNVEFQADQAAFGQWVAFLEEVAQRWHLYPTQLLIKAGDSPETVSIRAILQQDTSVAP